MPQIIRSPKVYDVCIVGSGAAGGAAAKVLTEGGLNAVMVEAGPHGLAVLSVDFHARSTHGTGDDWPIGYDDVALYDDKVESYIGVFGSHEGIASSPDGVFLPPPKPRCTETILKRSCDQLNIHCVPARMAIITRPLNGRPACHYCGQCTRGCKSASNFSSSQVLIPPALATGRLTLITNAMAREIVVGKDGRAEAVTYIDRMTRTEKQVHARSFVVAASTCESARLLLNSRSRLFPDGLANSSGVGRAQFDR